MSPHLYQLLMTEKLAQLRRRSQDALDEHREDADAADEVRLASERKPEVLERDEDLLAILARHLLDGGVQLPPARHPAQPGGRERQRSAAPRR